MHYGNECEIVENLKNNWVNQLITFEINNDCLIVG